MHNAKKGSWRLYLNGIDTPATSVTISLGAMAMPEADISLAPDRELLRLGSEDRIQVAVFYLDDIHTAQENKVPEYRLLFEGEVVAWGYENTPSGRALSLKAVNHANIFSQLFNFFLQNVEDFVTAWSVTGDTSATAQSYPTFPASLFYSGLNVTGADGTKAQIIKRPYDFIENIFRALFGSAEYSNSNSSVAANFFARWARRTNFINRWVPSPFIEGGDLDDTSDGVFPILKAFRDTATINQLMDRATSVAQSSSYWELIVDLLTKVYYEMTLLPNMPLVSYDLETGRILGPPEFGDDNTVGGIVKGRGPRDPKKPVRLMNYVTKPQMQFCVPPRCNIIFPSMVESYAYSESYAAQPTRLYIDDLYKASQISGGHPTSLQQVLLRTGYPKKVLEALKSKDQQTKLTGKNFMIYPEEFFKGPVVQRAEMPDWFYYLSNSLTQNPGGDTPLDAQKERVESLEQLYAEYEFNKERGTQRSGAVQMRFNPYVVPGFPTVILDTKETNAHVFGYAVNVTHALSASGMSTSMSYAYAQTFEEFFKSYLDQRNGFQERPELNSEELNRAKTALTQAQENLAKATDTASQGYKDALAAVEKAQGDLERALVTEIPSKSKALANSLQALEDAGQKNPADAAAQAKLKQQVIAAAADYSAATTSLVTPDMAPAHPVPDIRVRLQNIDKASEYYALLFDQGEQPNERKSGFSWRDMIGVVAHDGSVNDVTFDSAQSVTAQDGSARKQVTTNAVPTGLPSYWLKQPFEYLAEDSESAMRYISRPICSLDEYVDFHGDRGVKEGTVGHKDLGGVYYIKILNLVQGPGEEPEEDTYGNRLTVLNADTRKDWETRLLLYRNKVLSKTTYRG